METKIYFNKTKIISFLLITIIITAVCISMIKSNDQGYVTVGYIGILFFGVLGIPALTYQCIKKWDKPIMSLDKEGIMLDVGGLWKTTKIPWGDIEKIEFSSMKTIRGVTPGALMFGFKEQKTLFFFFKNSEKYNQNQLIKKSEIVEGVVSTATDSLEKGGLVGYKSTIERRPDIVIPNSILPSQNKIIDAFKNYNVKFEVLS